MSPGAVLICALRLVDFQGTLEGMHSNVSVFCVKNYQLLKLHQDYDYNMPETSFLRLSSYIFKQEGKLQKKNKKKKKKKQ